ncbi:hypothetical protein PF002_g2327 [Phytophthora fragariae]|uniref:Uncharacterized protein n=1 Tax=Phytophthora fragariae TaxID=53985 RepID=A0A6A4AE14_9STRA|nr:hypothetical protein PF003_g473 [Phytophthora fragariae]KAE9025949.1 hypothetical protein PF011_g2810 [Phytophthora fragariae]KAE9133394.1 hypothetical protein PF007_g3375 [Phytophthora fragariae]KAE9152928.1 hypothetical protein PF006_g2887 [Phytophthora fragariae]KAE9222609.1 hypothetical protein PF004_g12746 [Phytophthora fragariae]
MEVVDDGVGQPVKRDDGRMTMSVAKVVQRFVTGAEGGIGVARRRGGQVAEPSSHVYSTLKIGWWAGKRGEGGVRPSQKQIGRLGRTTYEGDLESEGFLKADVLGAGASSEDGRGVDGSEVVVEVRDDTYGANTDGDRR